MDDNWIHDKSLSGIDPARLQALLGMAEQGSHMSQKELLPFLMAAASKNKSKGTSFSVEETEQIINVLKLGKSQEELSRMNQIIQLMQTMRKH